MSKLSSLRLIEPISDNALAASYSRKANRKAQVRREHVHLGHTSGEPLHDGRALLLAQRGLQSPFARPNHTPRVCQCQLVKPHSDEVVKIFDWQVVVVLCSPELLQSVGLRQRRFRWQRSSMALKLRGCVALP